MPAETDFTALAGMTSKYNDGRHTRLQNHHHDIAFGNFIGRIIVNRLSRSRRRDISIMQSRNM